MLSWALEVGIVFQMDKTKVRLLDPGDITGRNTGTLSWIPRVGGWLPRCRAG